MVLISNLNPKICFTYITILVIKFDFIFCRTFKQISISKRTIFKWLIIYCGIISLLGVSLELSAAFLVKFLQPSCVQPQLSLWLFSNKITNKPKQSPTKMLHCLLPAVYCWCWLLMLNVIVNRWHQLLMSIVDVEC